jgi:Zn-dependent alcohol dehydrogenase
MFPLRGEPQWGGDAATPRGASPSPRPAGSSPRRPAGREPADCRRTGWPRRIGRNPTGIAAVLYIAEVEAGSTCAVFGAGCGRLGAVAGCRLAGANASSRSTSPRSVWRTPAARSDRHPGRQPRRGRADLQIPGGFGADYTFEATGNVAVMRQAVESARMGWGLCDIAGVAGRGEVLR